MERLLRALRFTGRVSVVVQNGKVLKSAYEEGYFTQRERDPLPVAEQLQPSPKGFKVSKSTERATPARCLMTTT